MFDVRQYLDDYLGTLQALDELTLERMALSVLDAWRAGRTVYCCGNGGSASSASHFVTDLAKLTTVAGGRRLRALALTESVSTLSAVANDIDYQEVFAEQLRTHLSPDDVVIGFSTSGSSPNVLRAIEYANDAQAVTLAVTGRQGTQLGAAAQITLFVESTSTQQIEDATMVVGHLLCLRVKDLIAQETADVRREERSLLLQRYAARATGADGAGATSLHAKSTTL
ncbi:MAG: SIS domain-containing protein [Vicinamibacterales bacterium]